VEQRAKQRKKEKEGWMTKHYVYNPNAARRAYPTKANPSLGSQHADAVLAALYHKTRKAFPEWMASELASRTGLSPDCVNAALMSLFKAGLAVPVHHAKVGSNAVWMASPNGQKRIAA
jgi:hypothetical protein